MIKKYILFFVILITSNCTCYGGNPFVDYLYPTFSKEEQKVHNEVIGYVMKFLQSKGEKWKCIKPNPFDKKEVNFAFYLEKEADVEREHKSIQYSIWIHNLDLIDKELSGKPLQELWDTFISREFSIMYGFRFFREITRTENVIECECIYDSKFAMEKIGVNEANFLIRYEYNGKQLIEKRFERRGGIRSRGLFTEEERDLYLYLLRNTPLKI